VPERLTQHDIAARIGGSREMVNRIVKDLTAGGYISVDAKQITVHKKLPRTGEGAGAPAHRRWPPKCASGTKPLCQATARTDDRKPKVVSIGQAISAGPEQDKETTMINRKNLSGESAFFAVTAIAICAVLWQRWQPCWPRRQRPPAFSMNSTATYAGPTGYFPDQFVNQAKENRADAGRCTTEPVPD